MDWQPAKKPGKKKSNPPPGGYHSYGRSEGPSGPGNARFGGQMQPLAALSVNAAERPRRPTEAALQGHQKPLDMSTTEAAIGHDKAADGRKPAKRELQDLIDAERPPGLPLPLYLTGWLHNRGPVDWSEDLNRAFIAEIIATPTIRMVHVASQWIHEELGHLLVEEQLAWAKAHVEDGWVAYEVATLLRAGFVYDNKRLTRP